MDLESFRREYLRGGLHRKDLQEDPIEQFSIWMQQALDLGIIDPTAMTMSTVASDGQPSQRIVLLKNFDDLGFVFYTNYESRKAKELSSNSKVSLLFPWNQIDRQVKICGEAQKLSSKDSRDYFVSRPRGSQIAAIASKQSSVIDSRAALMDEFDALNQKYKDAELPFPDFWGGYRVQATEIEFWQGGADRLHDRFRYLRDGQSWRIDRLAP
ncbi:MAG: pyridoxamine 5'-phosphate oxidase [Candidatus Marinimicrobia bacterium]|nr:pyridoxamine 5'-phosphate oxidase [Candidatus Neomarinimicrobiota bacterium]